MPQTSVQAPQVDIPDELIRVEQLLEQFEFLEQQLSQVREGLMQSHRLATLGTMATAIAHEFNNILTPVVSYAQLALAAPDDADMMRKAVEKGLAGALRAAQISDSLLGFARDATDGTTSNLRTVIDETIACMARHPEKDGLKLVLDVDDNTHLAMPPVQLQQVLLNLLLNARQAMSGQAGTIRVSADTTNAMVAVTVSDTGPGITPELLDRLFEPFVSTNQQRVDAASSDSMISRKGTGLGLSICRDLLENAGGSIKVQSVPGQGASFTLSIPKADRVFEST